MADPANPPPRITDNRAFLAWLEKVPDPEQRYTLATSAIEEYQEMVSQLSALRAGAVADASTSESVSAVARRFGVSRQRAHQLLKDAQAKGAPTPGTTRRKARRKGSQE
jgi:hypothetical protein